MAPASAYAPPPQPAIRLQLAAALDHARQTPGAPVLVFIDLDGFRALVDDLGEDAGRDLLAHVERRLRRRIRPSDVLCRFGRDEFVVVLGSAEDPLAIAERIRAAFSDSFRIGGERRSVRASVGVAVADHRCDADTLVARADRAMYAAKRAGGDTVRRFAPAC